MGTRFDPKNENGRFHYIYFMRTVNIYPISSKVCFNFMLDPQRFQTISQLDIPPDSVFLQCIARILRLLYMINNLFQNSCVIY